MDTNLKNNAINLRFQELQAKGEKALISFITAGDPNLETTIDLVLAMEKAGIDIIELGVPFSDPLADGPVIQKASQRALKQGVTLDKIINCVSSIREKSTIPIILMTYFNPLYRFGLEEFVSKAKIAGVDGLIIPDLPFEERDIITNFLNKKEIALIPLVAPTTPKERIKEICQGASGFIYCVSITGVTGIRQNLANNIEDFIKIVKEETTIPVAVGFGISTPEQGYSMSRISDGVIVGSAFVQIIEERGTEAVEEIVPLVRKFKGAILGIGGEE